MGAEQRHTIYRRLKTKVEDIAARKIVPKLVADAPRFLDTVRPIFAEGFEEAFKQEMAKGDVTPVIIAGPHGGHTDGLGVAVIANELVSIVNADTPEPVLKGFILPIAESMRTGHQGPVLQHGTDLLRPLFEQNHLFLPDYARKKDRTEYGSTSNNVALMRELIDNIQSGYGFAVFPETSVQAGRIEKDSVFTVFNALFLIRYGMQEFIANLDPMLRAMKIAHKKPLFIPACVYGGFNIVSPDTRLPTTGYIWEYKTHPQNTRLMYINVGLPITQEMVSQQPHPLNYFLGTKVAELTHRHARGVWKNRVGPYLSS